MLDLLIGGGMIIDGTGSPGYWGSVGIEGNQVRIIRGDVSEVEALRTMDAKGLMVAPGFIDVHAHSGLMILAEPRHEPKVLQGVTTELVGVDGNSYAPFKRAEDLRDFIRLNAGLDGDPGLKKLWTSVSDYLGRFDGKVAVNIAYLVGNSPLRINAVGWENRKATAREISVMKGLLQEAMEEGAFGLSTGLDYPPGSYADTEEVTELCREAARLGGIYHTHVRYWLGDRYLDPFKEALDIGRRSGVAVHITHLFHRRPRRGSAKRMLGLVEEARDGGMDVTFDCFPYPYGGTRLLIMLPQWAHDGGPSKLKAVLASEEGRERLRREVTPRAPSWDDLWLTYFRKPHNRRYDGLSVAEIAERMGKGPVDAICDLLVDEDLGISYTGAVVEPSTLPKFVEHELYMVGSDALLVGEHLSPMAYGTFPYILGEYVREEGRLRLEEAVRKMTGFPSQRLGLRDRGLLRDGMKADVVVFDAGKVGSEASMRESKKPPVGIEYVIVNGKVVVEKGRHTGVLAGRVVRRGR